MALTRLNNNAIGETITAAKGGTGVTSADSIGNLVKLQSVNVTSNVSSVDFDSTYITSDYDVYKIIVRGILPATDSVDFFMRYSIDGGSTFISTSNYPMVCLDANESTTNGNIDTRMDTSQNGIRLTGQSGNQGSADGERSSGEITFFNSNNTLKIVQSQFTYFFTDNRLVYSSTSQCLDASRTDTVNGLRFFYNSGDIASGELILYGVKT